jgi:hypothetical protein
MARMGGGRGGGVERPPAAEVVAAEGAEDVADVPPEVVAEMIAERAAIMSHDAGLPQGEAERAARLDVGRVISDWVAVHESKVTGV